MVTEFKDRLREMRLERGITQKALADKLGTYQANIAAWERGKTAPNMYSIIEITKFFGVTAGQLLGLEEY